MNLRELFFIHKSDRQVITLLLTIAVVAIVIINLVGQPSQEQQMATPADSLARLSSTPSSRYSPHANSNRQQHIVYQQEDALPAERFNFDPNTADSTTLLRLGLRPWQVRNIYKYRAKGGIYRKKTDFARLYGLTAKEYRELEPYIQISPDYLPATTLLNTPNSTSPLPLEETPSEASGRPSKLADGETIDLNLADTTQLKTVPGIGSYFARRIADYGARLGGYINPDQLDEISNFPSEAKAFFVVSGQPTRRLDVNRLSLNELKSHPYINYYQARAIVNHRRIYGKINDLDDLHLLPDFPPEAIARLRPYVSY